jgi:hypothetical protein
MIAYALLAGIALQTPSPLGSTPVGGSVVRPAVPSWDIPEPSGVRKAFADGSRLSSSGVRYVNDSWAEVATKFAALPDAASAKTWRVRVLVIQNVAHSAQLENGVRMTRYSSVDDEYEKALRNELGLMAALARVYSAGRLKIEFDYDLEPEFRFVRAESELSQIGMAELQARWMGSDERSFLIVHPARTLSIGNASFAGIPGNQIPFWATYDPARPGVLARYLFNAWVGQLQQTAASRGMQNVPRPDASAPSFTFQDGGVPPLRNFASEVPAEVESLAVSDLATRTRAKFPDANAASTEIAITPRPARLANPFNAGDAEKLTASGAFAMKTVADDERGSVGSFRERPFMRRGWVRILESQGSEPLEKTPYVEFMLKVRGRPSNLEVVVETDEQVVRYRLFDLVAPMAPVQTPFSAGSLVPIQLAPYSGWKKVVLDVRGIPGAFRGVYFAAPAEEYFAPIRSGVSPEFFVDDATLAVAPSQTPEVVATDIPSAASSRALAPQLRAAWAASLNEPVSEADQGELRGLLSDDTAYVVATALAAYQRAKIPTAIPNIAKLARSFDPLIAELAINALAFQNTDAAWVEIQDVAQRGPFEQSQRPAVEALSAANKPATPVTYSILLASRSWEARLTAARAIQKLPAKTSQVVALAFLFDVDPLARTRMLPGFDLTNDAVIKRLSEMVVEGPAQDRSPWVRGAAGARLAGAANPKAADAVRQVRADSNWVTRYSFAFQLLLKAETREAWRALLKDADPRVRLVSAERFAEWESLENNDWEALRSETDLRVVSAAIRAAQVKNFTVPADILELRARLLGS